MAPGSIKKKQKNEKQILDFGFIDVWGFQDISYAFMALMILPDNN